MKTNTFPTRGALLYGTPLVFIWAVAWWCHALVPVAICFGVALALVVAIFAAGMLLAVGSGQVAGSRLPWALLLVAACLAALSPLLFIVQGWHHRSQPRYVLEVLDQIRSRKDVQREENYLTPQGKDVLLWAMDQANGAPMTNSKDVYAEPVIRDDTCDIGLETKNGAGTIRLLKTDHWRFHDFYLGKSQGKDIGLWASYVKDHPYATAWTLLWK